MLLSLSHHLSSACNYAWAYNPAHSRLSSFTKYLLQHSTHSSFYAHQSSLLLQSSLHKEKTLELSVKYGKHSTRTLSLVIHRVRLKKKPAKEYVSITSFNGGWNSENHQFWCQTEFHPVFPFSWSLPLLLHTFSLLLTVQLRYCN